MRVENEKVLSISPFYYDYKLLTNYEQRGRLNED